jgi:hypothetical protein
MSFLYKICHQRIDSASSYPESVTVTAYKIVRPHFMLEVFCYRSNSDKVTDSDRY